MKELVEYASWQMTGTFLATEKAEMNLRNISSSGSSLLAKMALVDSSFVSFSGRGNLHASDRCAAFLWCKHCGSEPVLWRVNARLGAGALDDGSGEGGDPGIVSLDLITALGVIFFLVERLDDEQRWLL